ncbi:NADH dehydrogenase subunit 6 (mitochondrion) [Bryopsis sp. KO-2023]|nr:NADH dehydrogenase subunit 6 [Bryopsis sp. KO-2023]
MIFLVVYIGAIAVLFLFVVMMLNIKLAEINDKKYRYLPIGGLLGILLIVLIFCIIDNDLIALARESRPAATYRETGVLQVLSECSSALHQNHCLNFWPVGLQENSLTDPAALNYEGNSFQATNRGSAGRELGCEYYPAYDIFYNNLLFTEWSEIAENLTNIQAVGQCIYTYYFYFFICASFILLVAMLGAIVLTHHQLINTKTQKVIFQNTREFAKTIQKIN